MGYRGKCRGVVFHGIGTTSDKQQRVANGLLHLSYCGKLKSWREVSLWPEHREVEDVIDAMEVMVGKVFVGRLPANTFRHDFQWPQGQLTELPRFWTDSALANGGESVSHHGRVCFERFSTSYR